MIYNMRPATTAINRALLAVGVLECSTCSLVDPPPPLPPPPPLLRVDEPPLSPFELLPGEPSSLLPSPVNLEQHQLPNMNHEY